ncbi:hypothetical protein PE067_08430 [Paracoccus sp. DMF-8]|uniref:hypothetical protein n=1 Tax=Paracoccus sp. DMF-8 TaxID=3019445 RepID=UPI0023E886E8|nr:hypothetical protein [Paracoccus sp. DMF-8]MDF3606153.1 hypothetical protein [Paracoccus sp. DMF-8]
MAYPHVCYVCGNDLGGSYSLDWGRYCHIECHPDTIARAAEAERHYNRGKADSQAEIARLTRERDEALAKVAAAYEVAEPIRSLIELIEAGEITGLHCSDEFGLYLLGDDREPVYCAVTMTLEQLGKIGSTNPSADATAALNRVRAGAMREAAGINVSRTGRDWVADSLWDRIAQDHRDAILARADAVERGE